MQKLFDAGHNRCDCRLAAPTAARAQESAFQSADGKTSLYLGSGGAATFNFGDTKFSIGHQFWASDKHLFFGGEAFGEASSGTTTLFSSKIKVPEGGGDFFLGWHWDPNMGSGDRIHHEHTLQKGQKNSATWFLFDVGYSRSSFYVSNSSEPVAGAKRYFDRFRTFAVLNRQVNGWLLVGAAAGAERRNNLDDLTQVTFETTVMPAAVNTDAAVVKTQAGFFGNYRQYIAAPLYTDMLFILPEAVKIPGVNSRIAIDAFTRSDLAHSQRSADGGFGIFVTKKGAPAKAIGGLAASWNDGKIRVAAVASYSF